MFNFCSRDNSGTRQKGLVGSVSPKQGAMDSLEPSIAVQVAALRSYQDLHFKIDKIRRGSPHSEYADRFIVHIPCGLESVQWHVLYNAAQPNLPPDVVFPPQNSDFQPLLPPPSDNASTDPPRVVPYVDMISKPHVPEEANLLGMLLALRRLYVQYQRRKVEALQDDRIKFEISTIGHLEGLEVCLAEGPDRPEEVHMVIPLPGIDLSPEALLRGRDGPAAATAAALSPPGQPTPRVQLFVRFPLQRGGGPPGAPQLSLNTPPAVRDILGDFTQKLPAWTPHMCLMEYIPPLQEQLMEQVQLCVASVTYRCRFIEQLPRVFGRPLEVDTKYFRRASVLASHSGFVFIVHFHLSPQFPKDLPILVFQSSLHFNSNAVAVASNPYDNYPWSPRWDYPEMVRRIGAFVAEEAPYFRTFCDDVVISRR